MTNLYPPSSEGLLDEGRYRNEELRTLRNLVVAVIRLENSRSPEDVLEVLNTLVDWLRTPEQIGKDVGCVLRAICAVWGMECTLGGCPDGGLHQIPQIKHPRNISIPDLQPLLSAGDLSLQRIQQSVQLTLV